MHWAREKSTDHADCIVRHLVERGTVDSDGVRHSAKVAWRALALLQTEIENAGPGFRYVAVRPDTREDYPSRWLMRGSDGCEWETCNEYTFDYLTVFFTSSTPMLRLPPNDDTTAC
jgi:hypothetical protein